MSLPVELLANIFQFLEKPSQVFPCLLVNSTWHHFAKERLYANIRLDTFETRKNFVRYLERKANEEKENLDPNNPKLLSAKRITYVGSHRPGVKICRVYPFGPKLPSLSKILAHVDIKELALPGQFESFSPVNAKVDLPANSIQMLNVSYSTLQKEIILQIVKAYNKTLKTIDMSGIFRFKRLDPSLVTEILTICPGLETIILNNCQDIRHEYIEKLKLNYTSVKFVKDD